eukprot:5889669-Alexandrium_andersonii.AAC.1
MPRAKCLSPTMVMGPSRWPITSSSTLGLASPSALRKGIAASRPFAPTGIWVVRPAWPTACRPRSLT